MIGEATMRTKRTPPEKNSGRTTLKEIARIAGVSVSTASLVLSGKGAQARISEQVAQKVRQIATENDWAPNLLVRSLQSGRTHILSFYNTFHSRSVGDLYMDRLSAALERAAGAHGYNLLIHCDSRRTPDEVYQALRGGLSDGVLFFGPLVQDAALLEQLRQSNLPTVLVDHEDSEGVLSSVCDDVVGGIRMMAERLVAAGHRKIGAIDGYRGTDGSLRISALRTELARLGAELPEEWVVATYNGHYSPQEALEVLMRSGKETPTAIFCWHDWVGYRVLEACDTLGVVVPEELSLIGYDGVQWPSTSRHILTSVAVPLEQIADAVVALMDDLLSGKRTGRIVEYQPVTFVEGTTLTHPRLPQ